jgi:hypothetical protein
MTLPANQKLEDLFDLPRTSEVPVDAADSDDSESANDIQNNLPILPETLVALDKIESALPAVRGLEASDTEMDDLASKASESFDDLMSLGMQVDSRYASEIFAVASTMLGHAITAKTAKMNKKLRMIDLQLKKARLDQTEATAPATPTGEGRILNRNDLLRTLIARDQEKPTADK